MSISEFLVTLQVIGNEHLMPRFWVLTDHGRGQIILVIRGKISIPTPSTLIKLISLTGTMSLNEIAVDLTCEPEAFLPASTQPLRSPTDESSDDENPIPGNFTFPKVSETEVKEEDGVPSQYQVHGGILKLARAMGDIGKPVHLAVLEALYNNPDYGMLSSFCQDETNFQVIHLLDLILCGHSLGAGVASILGMV